MGKINFYAPYRMPDGRLIYGAAAANRRIAEAGGFNSFAYNMVLAGMKLGYEQAIKQYAMKQHVQHTGR